MSMLDGFEEYFHSKYENIVLESMEDIDLAFDFAIESASDKFVGLSPKDEEEILNGDWEDDEVTDMDNVDLSDDENFEPDEECGSLDSLLSLLDDNDDEIEALESLSAALEKSDSEEYPDDEDEVEECNESEDDDWDYFDDEDSDMFDDELDEPDEECGTESDISLESLLDDISNI